MIPKSRPRSKYGCNYRNGTNLPFTAHLLISTAYSAAISARVEEPPHFYGLLEETDRNQGVYLLSPKLAHFQPPGPCIERQLSLPVVKFLLLSNLLTFNSRVFKMFSEADPLVSVGLQSYDEQPLCELNSEAIDFRAASEQFAAIRQLKPKDLITLNLATPYQGHVVPTVAGIILYGGHKNVGVLLIGSVSASAVVMGKTA